MVGDGERGMSKIEPHDCGPVETCDCINPPRVPRNTLLRGQMLDAERRMGKARATRDPHEVFKAIVSSGVAEGWTPWGWFLAGWNARGMRDRDALWRFHADAGALLDMLPHAAGDACVVKEPLDR